jgi:hypothetical protein
MTVLDSASLKYWESLAEWGFRLVIIGVVGESLELITKWEESEAFRKWFGDRFDEKNLKRFVWFCKIIRPKRLPVESIFFGVVVIGLAMEFIGSQNATRISDAENMRLNGLYSDEYSNSVTLASRVEELRKKNNGLELAMASPVPPRLFSDFEIGWELSISRSGKLFRQANIIFESDIECSNMASQIGIILQYSKWRVKEFSTTKKIEDGIFVGVCSTNKNFDGDDISSACGVLVKGLNAKNIKAAIDNNINSKTSLRFNGMMILIGLRPTVLEYETEEAKKALNNSMDEIAQLEQQLASISKKSNEARTNSTTMAEMKDEAEITRLTGRISFLRMQRWPELWDAFMVLNHEQSEIVEKVSTNDMSFKLP